MTVTFVSVFLFVAAVASGQEVPDRPEKIAYPELGWTAPDPADYRVVHHDGANSPEIFVVEDPSLPLATFTVHFRAGTAADPVTEMGAALLLDGGTSKATGDEIRRRVLAMGGRIFVRAGAESGTAEISVLSRDLPEAVDILGDVLLDAAFREDEIAKFRERRADRLARRDDNVGALTARRFRELVLGADHPFAHEATPDDFAKIDREDLRAWREDVMGTRPLLITLAGRIPDREAILARIFARFGYSRILYASELAADAPAPAPTKIHLIDRPGATQGNVRIGGVGIPKTHPDFLALTVMNYILGGSGFPSRITQKVRSDEGLAYSVGSRLDTGVRLEGTYHVGFQTRSAMVPYAIRLVMDEVARMREDGVTDDELARAKQALADRQPESFDTPEDTADAIAVAALAGRPDDWHRTFRDRVMAITKEDVLRVAREHLFDPAKCVILVVGDAEAILAGDPSGAHPEKLSDSGEVVRTGAGARAPGERR